MGAEPPPLWIGGLVTPQPTIIDGRFVPTRDVPFDAGLDQLIADIRDGRAPNLGRFCSYCSAPLDRDETRCPSCATSVEEHPPRDKISPTLAAIYTAKRRREARYIHGAAWMGLLIGAGISVGLILVLPSWTKFFAIAFLIVGSYYIASYLGNVLAQDFAYRRGLRFFAQRWQDYITTREGGALDDD